MCAVGCVSMQWDSSYNSALDPARVELAQQAFAGFVDDHFDGRRAIRGRRAAG